MKSKALSTQYFENRQRKQMQQHILRFMNIAARRGRIARAKPLFTEEYKAKLFGKWRSSQKKALH